ncbi:phosphatidylinositol 3-kinase catalytic subunit type 3 [Colias croceus]|uniref:phosphatidylinositol 3-kinase catalytic subunit type 3 n=1 Tax=Colias crocea TaxID=72248 RepID=UPI001E280FB3|nr:phosphatidylinositol 3-kinase catalytic subunit type 3 [Colias croceus]
MNEMDDKFYYVYSSSLDHKVEIKIGTLEGKRSKPEYDKLLSDPMLKFSGLYQEGCSDLFVTCQVLCDGVPLALPVTTSYKAFTNRWNWNEWVTLPVYYSDLPRNAILAMTIYDCAGPGKLMVVGGTTISLFGKHGMLRQGMFDLRVWPGVEGSEKTPGKAPDRGKEQMQRLAKLAKKHRNGHMPKVDWLDRLTFREIEMINEKEKRNSNYMYLMIEFPTVQIDGVDHAVVYYEQDGDEMYQFRAQAEIVTVPDYEILQENLIESKQHRLARSVRGVAPARDAKPSAGERDRLAALLSSPPAPLSADEQDLIWKYRFYLSTHRRALTKFLECVNWNRPGEVRQALAMMKQWAPMDVEDALELLTPKFTHPAVRKYAISRLKQAPDEDLLLYLLQLVQALKYEDFLEIHEEYVRVCGKELAIPTEGEIRPQHRGSQATLLSASGLTASEMTTSTSSRHSDTAEEGASDSTIQTLEDNADFSPTEPGEQSLASFLISRACHNSALANYLYWYLLVECEDGEAPRPLPTRGMYLAVMRTLSHRLAKGSCAQQRTRSFLARQQVFIDKLVRLVKSVARESGSRQRKAERLQLLLADPDHFKYNFANFEPMPFPLDPTVTIKGIVAKKASLFKSALMPCKLTFLTTEGSEYEAIFKHGDDLRQDQLILQMITLMDKLLRRENLDLKLTPYKVLATSSKHGFLQFVESVTVAEALASEGSIQNFFRKHSACDTAPYGIRPDTMDTYLRSCAGYCVITYLLGEWQKWNCFRKHSACDTAPYGIRPDTMDTYLRSCAGYCVITYLLGEWQKWNCFRKHSACDTAPYGIRPDTMDTYLRSCAGYCVITYLLGEWQKWNCFRKHSACDTAPYGIRPDTMDTYLRSCAGYCVITYLLGVGDRHLDNLLLTKSGALFHIDFGYILGRDPKPLPPPMKLSKEMVEAMGGVHSEHYHEFRKQCYTAFLHLRRHANLMLNLFSLMVDASVPDIALEPDKAVKKVQDKLRLDLGDEEAVHYLQNLLDLSVTAVMAALVEHFHKFAQYWRK